MAWGLSGLVRGFNLCCHCKSVAAAGSIYWSGTFECLESVSWRDDEVAVSESA